MKGISFAINVLLFFIFTFHTLHSAEAGKLESLHDSSLSGSNQSRSFVIDYKNDVFLKDGKPFYYIAGSFHYFRSPRAYWRDRLRKLRAAGLNAVTTYIEWSSHEPNPGDYRFSGDNDIEHFIQVAAEEDLLVILRPGPYICAERDFGGLPPWLLTKYPNIRLRTNDKDYEYEVKKWFDVVFKKLEKFFYGNGGPIITVQVENEYGSLKVCDMKHKLSLRDQMKKYVRDAAVLFTTDVPEDVECGYTPGVYATVDFGTARNVTEVFAKMRKFSPHGPLVNSEFYPGWLSHWGEPMERRETEKVVQMMKEMLDLRANFNFYMFFGGTNFGLTNGANFDTSSKYVPQLTSYDYDAPLDEAGDPTPKYFAIRDLISKYDRLPDLTVPEIKPKGNYGKIQTKAVYSIFDDFFSTQVVGKSPDPKTFEFLKVNYGYVLYETTIPDNTSDPAVLYVSDVRDRATVYLDHVPIGILDRARSTTSIPTIPTSGSTLSLLVENQGRLNWGRDMNEPKGLISVPLLNGQPLADWTMTGLSFENVSRIYETSRPKNDTVNPPAIYIGELVLPPNEQPLDTYIDPTGWGKGIIFVNDFNIGRYWPSIGSQVTLYVPGCHLQPNPYKNKILLFETEHVPKSQTVIFTNKPNLDKIPPPSSAKSV